MTTSLTLVQAQTLKTYIASIPAWDTLPKNSDSAFFIAAELNKPSSPTFLIWNSAAKVNDILDSIDWSKYTPVAAMDNTALADTLIASRFTAQLLAAQTKQINLQLMLQGRETVDANKANIRGGLRDAVIQIPTGTNGASVVSGGASGVNTMNALVRNASLVEQVLAGSQVQTGGVTANLTGYEGTLTYQDIEYVWSV